ncbi:pectinesterase family protein [Bythopirellula polymerisocia]|uniref:Pectinesterase A n=1 Tax=Bythopirellula polymerisocia TaxID=2528003 RepID=A0A5C6CV93_9BACT|nr:pectinesterase family protein [Bythopirellula polymerisocia]TWU27745.1 Pectinesterase A precursor [Bythopirellula polymerisocia]
MSSPATTPASLILLLCASSQLLADVHLIVGTPEQGGQFTSVQTAISTIPASNAERYVIDIMPGIYTERVFVVPDRVTLRGMGASPNDTKLTYFETANTPPNESTVHASTVVRGKDFVAENLTFENSAGQNAGQALAIYARGDRSIFNNCRFLGWQDTLRSESGRHYFFDSYAEGSVDFIYGKGQAYFENSTLFAKAPGYLTAQGREQANETNGYVFKNSTIMGSAPNGSVYLGRPWQAYSRAIFIDTKMSSIINSAGWQTWSGNNHLTSYFAEYNSMDLAGNPLDVSARANWSHQLTDLEAAAFSKEVWLAGSDGWNPIAEILPDPSADFDGDGDRDGRDFLVWQRDPGIGNLADWQANYGVPALTNAFAVPEPASCVLIIALLSSSSSLWRCR